MAKKITPFIAMCQEDQVNFISLTEIFYRSNQGQSNSLLSFLINKAVLEQSCSEQNVFKLFKINVDLT